MARTMNCIHLLKKLGTFFIKSAKLGVPPYYEYMLINDWLWRFILE